jgi:hypothetical protein
LETYLGGMDPLNDGFPSRQSSSWSAWYSCRRYSLTCCVKSRYSCCLGDSSKYAGSSFSLPKLNMSSPVWSRTSAPMSGVERNKSQNIVKSVLNLRS